MSKRFRFVARTLADTERVAEAVARVADANAVLALDGDLGAGKTTFAQRLAAALGVTETVNSPTFSIIKEYEAATMPFFHMDVYRIDAEQAGQLGLDEYFFGGGVTLVEWASLIVGLLPDAYLKMEIQLLSGEQRQFVLTPLGEPYVAWVRGWHTEGWVAEWTE